MNFESMSYVPHVDYLRTRHKKVILLPTGLGMVRGMDQKWKDVPYVYFFFGGGVNFESISYPDYGKTILLPTGGNGEINRSYGKVVLRCIISVCHCETDMSVIMRQLGVSCCNTLRCLSSCE